MKNLIKSSTDLQIFAYVTFVDLPLHVNQIFVNQVK